MGARTHKQEPPTPKPVVFLIFKKSTALSSKGKNRSSKQHCFARSGGLCHPLLSLSRGTDAFGNFDVATDGFHFLFVISVVVYKKERMLLRMKMTMFLLAIGKSYGSHHKKMLRRNNEMGSCCSPHRNKPYTSTRKGSGIYRKGPRKYVGPTYPSVRGDPFNPALLDIYHQCIV